MINTKETVYTADTAAAKLKVVRSFDAPPAQVWRAWTEAELLDQWWAPRPWQAVTKSQDFSEGGRWHYYMEGPEGEKHHCWAEYSQIVPQQRFNMVDGFESEQGQPDQSLPEMRWQLRFIDGGETTRVEVELSFDSKEDMDKIIQMGFKEGFGAAHGNLDELLLQF